MVGEIIMKEYKIKCRYGETYRLKLLGKRGPIARTIYMLENCCCYVCHNHNCNKAIKGKQDCKNECEFYTSEPYCKND